jgi:hypothetical protein
MYKITISEEERKLIILSEKFCGVQLSEIMEVSNNGYTISEDKFPKCIRYIDDTSSFICGVDDLIYNHVYNHLTECKFCLDRLIKVNKLKAKLKPKVKEFPDISFNLEDDLQPQLDYYEKLFIAMLNDRQKEWLHRLINQDNYKVLWITDYDTSRNKEKYDFCAWLEKYLYAQEQLMCTHHMNETYDQSPFVYINLCGRDSTDYDGLSHMKDGSAKSFTTDNFPYRRPNLVVFSNFSPCLDMLSKTRWDLIKYSYGDD